MAIGHHPYKSISVATRKIKERFLKIEVACKETDSTKSKGDLLENLANDLLIAQGYEVIEEIRITGAELDLLCKHRVSGKTIYVECKAQKEKISAPILRQLLGTVIAYDYAEGWLISTAELGKEAKGFAEQWRGKNQDLGSKLSFYTPKLVIDSLQSSSIICKQPISEAIEIAGGEEKLGDWFLLVTAYGRFWVAYALQGGAPCGAFLFNAVTSKRVTDEATILNISRLDSSLAQYDLTVDINNETIPASENSKLPRVVEVQTGDSWDDYRPARPQDFVGRDNTQKEIINFLSLIQQNKVDTRVFAITGNSGLGKSSLIAKLRSRTRNKFYAKRFFTYAIDIRGAATPSYIASSLLSCFKSAQDAGFGDDIELQLTDPTSLLASGSITRYLESLKRKKQIICLVFDQFEELYSKPELFGIFNAAKDLMLEVAAYKANLALGFAWKTDSTTQHDHPAYHMWHDLSDHRRVYKLDVFLNGEISKAITTFEKEIDQKIPVEIRHQISNSSQGFPWLLKKLCINLYDNMKKETDGEALVVELDVSRLFENDIENLTPQEYSCLKLVAQKAPADWGEIIEISGVGIVNSLVHKRLIIKSGSRLNIYWDIFKDYLLTGAIPVIPFNYIPTSDFSSMYKVATKLNEINFTESIDIANESGLNERTVWNIGADLVMFGIAERKNVKFKLHRDLEDKEYSMMERFREKLGKHSLKIAIYKSSAGKVINSSDITKALKTCIKNGQYSEKTWQIYSNRLIKLLMVTGFLSKLGNKLLVQDSGASVADAAELGRRSSRQRGVVFSAMASPASVCEALELLKANVLTINDLIEKGYRNSIFILDRFDLITKENNEVKPNLGSINKLGGSSAAVWSLAKNEPAIAKCIEKLSQNPNITGVELGDFLSSEYQMPWTDASKTRNGNSLKQWSSWVKDGIDSSLIPEPPGRAK